MTGCFCGDRLKRRVLRGGSFDNNQQNARCAYRNNNHPNNWNNNIGFRVVVHSLPAFRATGRRQYSALVTAGAARSKAGAADSWPSLKLRPGI